jgi:hypothetical protein
MPTSVITLLDSLKATAADLHAARGAIREVPEARAAA